MAKKEPKLPPVKHVAIAGNIGAGKTTLTGLLAKHFNWEAHYEDVENNPYLYDFYENMPRWSFNLQIYFLNSRFNQVRTIRRPRLTDLIIRRHRKPPDSRCSSLNKVRTNRRHEM